MPEYILDDARYSTFLVLYGEVFCYKCDKFLYVGDFVVSVGSKFSRKLYHKDCWDSMFIDC